MKKLFINNSTSTVIITNEKNSFEYETEHFSFLFKGTKKECLTFLDEYWEENFFEEEKKQLINM